jgi:galactofuranose transport system permease protein
MSDSIKRLFWPVLALTALLLLNAIITPHFFRLELHHDGRFYGSMIDVLSDGSKVMLLSLGMTLVIAGGGIDLSVGAVMALSATTAFVMVNAHYPFAVAMLGAFGIAAVAGLINGVLVAVFNIQPIVATLVLMVAGRGVAQLIAGAPIVTSSDSHLAWFFRGHLLHLPIAVWLVLFVFIIIWLLTRGTAMGMMIEATGDNSTAARYVGIPVRQITIAVYLVSGLCAALAGIIEASSATSADTYNNGLYLELDAILAVVIGGTALTGGRFYLLCSLLGALLIQLLSTTLLQHDVRAYYLPIPKAIAVIVVVIAVSPRFHRRMLALKKRIVPARPTASLEAQ